MKNLILKTFVYLFNILVVILFVLAIIVFLKLSVSGQSNFLVFSKDNYEDFIKIVQAMSVFTIPMALILEGLKQENEKKKIKIERTMNYINTWREGNLYSHYISIQNVLSDIYSNPKFEHIFEYSKTRMIKEGQTKEFKLILDTYLNDIHNKEKQHDFGRIRSFLSEVLVLVDKCYLSKELLDEIFIPEIMYVWESCYYYYQDSDSYGDKAKNIQAKLFDGKLTVK